MEQMNGAAAAPLDADRQAVVKVLETLLAEAKAGKIVCIGVAVVRDHKAYTTTGTLAPLYLMELAQAGQDLNELARNAMRQIAQQQAQAKPTIIRPSPNFRPPPS